MSSKSVIKLSKLHHICNPLIAASLEAQCRRIAALQSSTTGASFSLERRYATSQSPKVRQAEWARKQRPPSPQKQSHLQWPTAIFNAAYRTGGLPIEPVKAVGVLEGFCFLTKYNRPTSGAVRQLCKEHSIQPAVLTMLAQILLKVGDAETFPVLRELLLSASALEDEAATMILVNQAVETNRMSHPDIAGPRAHLARLAQASHPAAVVLQAELLAAQGQTDKALRMCEDVVQADIDDYMGADVLGDSAKRKAWNAIAKLRKEKGDMAGAKLALEAAAFHHDDPWAYYYLADNYRRPDDSQYLLFMLKAAASGIPNAAYKLGRYYLGLTRLSKKKLEQRNDPGFREALAFGTKYKEEEKRLLAAEWFSVAAESPAHKKIDDSRVYLALLLRAQGDLAGGRTLLKQAANSVVWGPNAVPWFLERWSSQQDFLTMEFLEKNMEQVVQGEYKGT